MHLRCMLTVYVEVWVFSPHSFLMVQQPGLSYQQVSAYVETLCVDGLCCGVGVQPALVLMVQQPGLEKNTSRY